MFQGQEYPSAEHAFAAAKTLDPAERARIGACPTPGQAQKTGRELTLRPEWGTVVRYEAMEEILSAKFTDPEMAQRLAATGDALLVERNTWHDQHWGDCRCTTHREFPGYNHLGRSLMALRASLRSPGPQSLDHWPRVGFTGHRDLEPEDRVWLSAELVRVMTKLRTENDAGVLINGMAVGADLLAAEAGLDAGVALWAYMPFPDQSARWKGEDVLSQERLRVQAQRTVVLGDGPASGGPRNRYLRLLHDRNRLIVRDSDVLVAVHDRRRTSGGTWVTIGHARAAGLAVVKVDPHRRDTRISR